MIHIDLQIPLADFTMEARLDFNKPITALFGPSGAGKTSLLEAIAGLKKNLSGEIAIDSQIVFSSDKKIFVPAEKRSIGYVPQDMLLFPHLNVRKNILYGAGNEADYRAMLESVLETLQITHLLDRNLGNISGGERQRVCLARALMIRPKLLLLDEPMTAVDVDLRKRILPYLRSIRDIFHIPILYVTHDAADILSFCDDVVLLEKGRVMAHGSSTEVLGKKEKPAAA